MRFLVLLLLFLNLSCEQLSYRTVTVLFPSEHFWESESGSLMWYTLEYFNGSRVERLTLRSGERKVSVPVLRGCTVYFVARPEDSYHPFGGGLDPSGGDRVYLTQREGLLAEILIEASRAQPHQCANYCYETIRENLEYPFDEDELLLDLRNGIFRSSDYKVSLYDVPISGIPEGRYIPETDYDPPFQLSAGQEITLSLYPGIHRYLNLSRHFLRTIAVASDGSIRYLDTAGLIL
ncbi:MAG: hypothetical protein IJ831_03940 [Spirochaetales bacterium]|nr:hypothetical protein [Spirochaetales bacterium]